MNATITEDFELGPQAKERLRKLFFTDVEKPVVEKSEEKSLPPGNEASQHD